MNKSITSIGIIPDGNRRYEKKYNLLPGNGHVKGINNLKRILTYIENKYPEITTVTVYGLSVDNIKNRTPEEVNFLMSQYARELSIMEPNGFQTKVIGDYKLFPKDLVNAIAKIPESNSKNKLNLLIGYNEQDIKTPIDLVIRTGGEQRLSGFCPSESRYATLFFLDKLWPEFTPVDFEKAVEFNTEQKQNYGK